MIHHQDRHSDRRHDALHPTVAIVTSASRRHLLALLATIGLGMFGERYRADAKKGRQSKNSGKGKGKSRNKGKKRGGGQKGGNGGAEDGGGYSPDGEERAFLDLINAYRRRHGAGNLSLDNRLGAAADYHSEDMASKNYFSHKLANGDSATKNIERFGYTNYRLVGENIAAGYETAREAMNAWEKSPEHDRNMRDPGFTQIGIGRAHDGNSEYGWYWTTTFGG